MPYAHVCGAVCIATIGGLTFEDGGGLTLAPVKVDFTTAAGTLVPDAAYSGIWSPTREYLPLGDTGMSVLPSPVPSSVKISLADVATQQRRLGWLFSQIRCSYIHGKLESLRRMDPSPPTVRWVGTGSPGSALGCNGISRTPGSTILLLAPLPETLAHELSHTLGLAHTLSLEGQPAGAEALPYVGIGANGYRTSGTIFEPHKTSDLMGYTDGRQNGRWTSPRTWFRTHVAIVGRVAKASGAGTGVARVAASASHAPKLTRRRLVSGLLARGAGVIFSSRVVDATANAGGSPVIGRLVALDRRGRRIAAAPVTGTISGESSRAGFRSSSLCPRPPVPPHCSSGPATARAWPPCGAHATAPPAGSSAWCDAPVARGHSQCAGVPPMAIATGCPSSCRLEAAPPGRRSHEVPPSRGRALAPGPSAAVVACGCDC